MTLPTREQLIEAMALPIHEGNCCTSWEQALKSAEAALNALIAELPPGLSLEQSLCGKDFRGDDVIVNQLIIDERAEHYKQFLAMGNK